MGLGHQGGDLNVTPVADKKDNAGMGGNGADREDNAGTGERYRGGDINAFKCTSKQGGQCKHEERALGWRPKRVTRCRQVDNTGMEI